MGKSSSECFICGRLLRARNSLYFTFGGNTWRVRACSVCYSGAPNRTPRTAWPWSIKMGSESASRVRFSLEGVKVK